MLALVIGLGALYITKTDLNVSMSGIIAKTNDNSKRVSEVESKVEATTETVDKAAEILKLKDLE